MRKQVPEQRDGKGFWLKYYDPGQHHPERTGSCAQKQRNPHRAPGVENLSLKSLPTGLP